MKQEDQSSTCLLKIKREFEIDKHRVQCIMNGWILTWECVFYCYCDIFGISELSFIMEENGIVLSYREKERDRERQRDRDGDRDRVENSII